jgi:hypothetical protein
MKKIIFVDFQDLKTPEADKDYILTPRQTTFVKLLANQIHLYLEKHHITKIKIISSSFLTSLHAGAMISIACKIETSERKPEMIDDELKSGTDEAFLDEYKKKILEQFTSFDAVIVIPSQELLKPFLLDRFIPSLHFPIYQPIELGLATAYDIDTEAVELLHWFPPDIIRAETGLLKNWFVEAIGADSDIALQRNHALDAWVGSSLMYVKINFLLNNKLTERFESFSKRVKEIDDSNSLYHSQGFKSLKM